MLTLILLVVLGGGVGLLAVSLAESPKPATDDAPARRADPPEPAAEAAPEPVPVPVPAPDPPPTPDPPPVPDPVPAVAEPVAVTAAVARAAMPPDRRTAPTSDALPRRVDRGPVPRAYTAVEGRYQDVIRPPVWRRLVSLALIVVIAVGIGVAIAAILGALIGAVAEVLGNTIG